MQRSISRRGAIAAGTAGIASLAGCGILGSEDPFERAVAEGWPIDIGVLAPLSGPFERFGEQMQEAITVVEAQVMAADTEYWVDFTIEDTESDPATAVEAASSLHDDGIEVFLGPALDESVIDVMDEVLFPETAAGITPIGVRGWDATDTEDLLFSTAPTTSSVGNALARMVDTQRYPAVSIIHGDGVYGSAIQESLEADLSGRGVDIPVSVTVDEEAEEIDASGIIEEAHEADSEAVVLITNPGDGQLLLEEYYDQYDPKDIIVTDRMRDPELPDELGIDLEGVIAVGIEPAHTRGGFAGRVEEYEEGVIAELDVDLGEEIENLRGDTVDLSIDDDLEAEDILQPFHVVFDALFDHRPTIQTMQAYDAAVILMLAGFQVGEGNYSGDRVGSAIPRVADFPGAVGDVASYGHRDWWDGLGEIGGGVTNAYDGATGNMHIVELTGLREDVEMNAVEFAPDTEEGFEEVFPLGTM